MYYLLISAIIILLSGIFVWIYKTLLPSFAKKKALSSLLTLIFPSGKEQQDEVMKVFHQFTSNRFTDDQILDYFIKIKGLQTLDLKTKTDFWVKRYLLTPTNIRLNYFEQVNFYKTFMNYPNDFGITENKGKCTKKPTHIFKEEISDMVLNTKFA